MKEEEIVKKVCEIMGVKYSHYDNHDMSSDNFPVKISAKPKIVAYSSRMGMWQFAILEDMTVITSTSESGKLLLKIEDSMKQLGIKNPERKKYYNETKRELNRIGEAEKWLKENNCQKVINDKNKKIHLEW